MIEKFEHFNERKARVQLLYSGPSVGMASCLYERPSEDAFYMPKAAITYVQRGRKVVWVNGEQHEMKTGDTLFVPKNAVIYSDISVKKEPFISVNVLADDEALLTRHTLQQALQLSRQEMPPPCIDDIQPDQGTDVLAALAGSITSDIPLIYFARMCHMSLSTFKRWCYKQAGQSPHQWVIARRLERARYLILHKQLPVGTAAAASGFSDVSYFIRRYKQAFGSTPGAALK